MYRDSHTGGGLGDLVRDPLVRLMMTSDGVSETELVALMARVRRILRGDGGIGATTKPARGVPFRAPARQRGARQPSALVPPIPADPLGCAGFGPDRRTDRLVSVRRGTRRTTPGV